MRKEFARVHASIGAPATGENNFFIEQSGDILIHHLLDGARGVVLHLPAIVCGSNVRDLCKIPRHNEMQRYLKFAGGGSRFMAQQLHDAFCNFTCNFSDACLTFFNSAGPRAGFNFAKVAEATHLSSKHKIYMTDIKELNERIQRESEFIDMINLEMDKVIVGQKYMVDRLLIGLLSNGHILLEGVPGLAKTLAIKSLASTIDAKFSRIQFTPDLLPADLIGTMIYNQKKEEFIVRKGPLFANFILADEINRAPAKVQSALLEAMQEKQVTIGEETFRLPQPFLVLATQNPIEQEGTYPLPEAQVDRFMLKVVISYPNRKEEREMLERLTASNQSLGEAASATAIAVDKVLNAEELRALRTTVNRIYIDERVKDY